MTTPLSGMSIEKPPAPSNPIITRESGTSLRISWDPSTDDYHKTYIVYRSLDNFTTETIVKNKATSTSFTDKDLDIDTWYYRVADIDIYEVESDPSDTVSYEIKELLPFTDTFVVTTGTGVVTKDINDPLGRNATSGTVINNGPEIVTVELSYDGTNFPKTFNMMKYDVFNLTERKNRIAIDSMRFTSTDASITAVVT